MTYIELHRHSSFSTLDGCGSPRQFAERAAELGMWALSQTDHGNLNGALYHIKACDEFGIQPILGIEAYYRPDRRVQGQKDWQHRRWHMVLLAQNLTGWHNLVRLSSEAFATGFYQSPCIDDELLDMYGEGVACTTSCVAGPLTYLIENANEAQIDAWLDRMAMRFKDRFYIAIQPHLFDRQVAINPELVHRAARKGLPLIAEGDAHYPYEGWASTQKIVTLISTNTTIAEAKAANKDRIEKGLEVYEIGHEGLHLMSEEEISSRFAKHHPSLPESVWREAISNTEIVAQSCIPFMLDRSLKMPRGAPTMEEAERRVMEWVREGMDRIGKTGDPQYERQIEHEMSIMRKKRVFDYIYLTGDVVRWARSTDPLPPTAEDPNPASKHPIRVGSSRGSAGASLVCYCCRITGINPINHRLKFERFLNPGRKGLPDIDIDFPDDKRDLVKEYVARKYGRDHVADIMAMSRFTPRSAIRDVARIMGVDYDHTKSVTDLIDPVHDEDLEDMRQSMPEIDKWARMNPTAWQEAVRLENKADPLCSRISKHAGGVVITPGPVTDHMPTIRASESDGMPRTAWSETPRLSIVDDFGFCKWDFLSIRGMTQQNSIVTMVAERTGEHIDLDQLPVCFDPYAVEDEVMEVFRAGLTLGVWQFEGQAITSYIKRARPENVVDLSAINALFRPGPMGAGGHERYIKHKNGLEPYEIPIPLIPVLSDTYGTYPFQEQIMEIFQVLVGYSAAQADDVRKEIDKLNRGKSDQGRIRLAARKDEFISQASDKIGEERAKELWEGILPFTGYSFNRPHASGYSVQAYQDAWLKVHYPLEFYAVLLTLEDEKAPAAIKESRYFGVQLDVPDINRSQIGFSVDHDTRVIRFGLIGVDGIGDIAARQAFENQPYHTLLEFDMKNSFKGTKLNKGHRQALLEAGALDSLGARADWTESQKASAEMRRLGMALRVGGTFGAEEELISRNVHSQDEVEAMAVDERVVIAGRVTELKKMRIGKGVNKGKDMARARLRFGLDWFDLIFFYRAYSEFGALLEPGRGLIVDGKKDARGQILVNGAMDVGDWVREFSAKDAV